LFASPDFAALFSTWFPPDCLAGGGGGSWAGGGACGGHDSSGACGGAEAVPPGGDDGEAAGGGGVWLARFPLLRSDSAALRAPLVGEAAGDGARQ
jgi:hypothetical protein